VTCDVPRCAIHVFPPDRSAVMHANPNRTAAFLRAPPDLALNPKPETPTTPQGSDGGESRVGDQVTLRGWVRTVR
jgi:hypothetical protein